MLIYEIFCLFERGDKNLKSCFHSLKGNLMLLKLDVLGDNEYWIFCRHNKCQLGNYLFLWLYNKLISDIYIHGICKSENCIMSLQSNDDILYFIIYF